MLTYVVIDYSDGKVFTGFGLEACRSMVALTDVSMSHDLEYTLGSLFAYDVTLGGLFRDYLFKEFKSNLHYTRDITPKRVTSGGVHLRALALGNTAPKKHRSDGDSVPI